MATRAKCTPATIDEYLAGLRPDQRAALERVRRIVRATVPRAEEGISYGLPAFRLDGKWFVWFGAAAKHCALYGVLRGHEHELRHYDSSGKGTIRFPTDDPLPATLVRTLVRDRIARNCSLRRRPRRGSAGGSMTVAQIRQFALSLPEVTEEPHFEKTSFRVRGKILATATADGRYLHLFVDERQREVALDEHPNFLEELFWGKKVAGLRVTLSKAAPAATKALLVQAWENKAPKSLRFEAPAAVRGRKG